MESCKTKRILVYMIIYGNVYGYIYIYGNMGYKNNYGDFSQNLKSLWVLKTR